MFVVLRETRLDFDMPAFDETCDQSDDEDSMGVTGKVIRACFALLRVREGCPSSSDISP